MTTQNPRILVIATTNRGEKVSEPLTYAGADVHFFQFTGKEDIVPLYSKVKHIDPSILITDSIGWVGAITFGLGVLFAIPYVVRVRGDAIAEHKSWLCRYIEERKPLGFFKEVAKSICTVLTLLGTPHQMFVSKYLPTQSKCRPFTRSNWTVVHTPCTLLNGDSHFGDQSEDNESVVILAVTSFVFYEKTDGLVDALEILAEYLKGRSDFELRIAGAGKFSHRVQQIANQSEKITLLGFTEDVSSEYRDADIFIHFSRLDAYPSTVLEAQIHELPIVANAFGGMKEQVKDGETGFLVDLDNAEHVVQTINTLVNSPTIRRQMGERGRKQVIENNSLEQVGEEMLDYVTSIISRR